MINNFNRPYSIRAWGNYIYILFGYERSNLAVFSLDAEVLEVRKFNRVLDMLVVLDNRLMVVVNSFQEIVCLDTNKTHKLLRSTIKDTKQCHLNFFDTGSNFEFQGGSIVLSEAKEYLFLENQFLFNFKNMAYYFENKSNRIELIIASQGKVLKTFERGRETRTQIRKIVDVNITRGSLSILDSENYTKVNFTPNFEIDCIFGSKGESMSHFDRANGITYTPKGELVCDMNNDRILQFIGCRQPQIFYSRNVNQFNRPVHISYSSRINDQLCNCLLATSRGSKSIHVLDLNLSEISVIDLSSCLKTGSPFAAFSYGGSIIVLVRDSYTSTSIVRLHHQNGIWKFNEILYSSEDLGDCQDGCLLANHQLAIPSVTKKKLFVFDILTRQIIDECDLRKLFCSNSIMVKNINYCPDKNVLILVNFDNGLVVELTLDLLLKRKFQIENTVKPAFRGVYRISNGNYIVLNRSKRSSDIHIVDNHGASLDNKWLSGRLRNPAKVLQVNGLYYVCNKEADEIISVDNTGVVQNVYR
jgi:hypothetical protein